MKIHSLPHNIFQNMVSSEDLFESPEKITDILNNLSQKIAKIMDADVCSLYLTNPETHTLTLKATHGLNTNLVDQLTFKIGIGLTGMAAKLVKPITVSNVKRHKNFLPIPDLGDEKYKSFLGVPLIYAQKLIGVIVVQNQKTTLYKKKDIQLLLQLSVPAVSVIERAKFMGAFDKLSKAKTKTSSPNPNSTTLEYLTDHIIKGIPAAPGIAIGHLKVIQNRNKKIKDYPDFGNPNTSKKLFLKAIESVKADIEETKNQAALKFGPEELNIFEAYSLILDSESFQKQILEKIHLGMNPVKAVESVSFKYAERISESPDDYIRERAYDIQDLSQKIIDRLLFGKNTSSQSHFQTNDATIFLNENWSISDFIKFNPQDIKGILSPNGGAGSHISILADAANIPSIFGIGNAANQLKDGDLVIIDGSSGKIIINPSEEVVKTYKSHIVFLSKQKESFQRNKTKRILINRDNKRTFFPIGANIELLQHADISLKAGADEIGLFRTEFPFLTSEHLPTEEEQLQYYKKIIESMKGKEVTFRTLDIGGDKYVSYLDLPKESNPFLGWRSIRFSLERQDLFRIQLRALLRSSQYGKIRIMFPMVTAIEEVQAIEQILSSVKKELHDNGTNFNKQIPIGYMIEVPATVEISDKLAKHADFFSIGTNDLIQYGLAVDRTNPQVAHLYNPYHPAIIRMISRTIQSAHKNGIKVSVCGEVASRCDLVACLIGLNIDALSMNPNSIPKIKHFIRKISYNDSKKLSKKILRLDTSQDIQNTLNDYFTKNGWQDYLGHPLETE